MDLDRRQFIAMSGAGLAGLALGSRHAATQAVAEDAAASKLTAWLVLPVSDGAFEAVGHDLVGQLEEGGYAVRSLSAAYLSDAFEESADDPDLLVLIDAARLPADTVRPMTHYLRSGGNCIVLNAPAWSHRMVQVDGEWISAETLEQKLLAEPLQGVPPQSALVVSGRDTRLADQAGPEPIATGDGPNPEAPGLVVGLEEMHGWDDVALDPESYSIVSNEKPITVIAAKGDTNTTGLAVRWHCDDGSVWSAVIPLNLDWRLYALSPEMFRYRYGGPAGAEQRGFEADRAQRLHVAQDQDETGRRLGRREYAIGLVGAVAADAPHAALAVGMPLPQLETIAPIAKGYACTEIHALRSAPEGIETDDSFALPSGAVWAPHVRPQGGGFDSERNWRWAPLVEAWGEDGTWRGASATLICFDDGRFKSGMWASFGISDAAWYRQPSVQTTIGQIAEHMAFGVVILDGGSDKFTYFDGQSLVLGVRISNIGRRVRNDLWARVHVLDAATNKPLHTKEWPVDLTPGASCRFSEEWIAPDWGVAGLLIQVDLVRGDTVIDSVEHEAHVWRPPQAKHWVRSEGGRLQLDGAPWRIHGMNYFPASAVAIDDRAPDGPGTFEQGMFEFWTRPDAYDPKIVQRDLERIKALGFNTLSVTLWCETSDSQNPLDFLRRAHVLGFKLNLAIRYYGHTHLTYDWDTVKDTIEKLRLWEHDSVFAIDVDWEPMFFPWLHDRFAPGWEAWVIERYGSIENAEQDWGVPICHDEEGNVKLYDYHMIDSDGPWRVMIAALRRYLDTVLYEHYSRIRRDLHTLLPNALVSFRMHSAGDPDFHWNQCIAFDFAYLGGAVDLFQPEGYYRKISWERMVPGFYTVAYARWANPDLPVFWAEAGTDTWIEIAGSTTEWSLDQQRRDAALFYRMLIETRSDGIAWWWWPGGCRYVEVSDYGAIHPDGTARPVSHVYRDHKEPFLNADGPEKPTDWLEFDRDRHVDGIRGMYNKHGEEVNRILADGGRLGLRTTGTGTDSRTCPAIAVGGAPWTGTDPPKYLDGFFDTVEWRVDDHAWQPLDDKAIDLTSIHETCALRFAITNLGEATWLSPEEETDPVGTVSLVLTINGAEYTRIPLADRVRRFEKTTLEIIIPKESIQPGNTVVAGLNAHGRTSFGPRLSVRL